MLDTSAGLAKSRGHSIIRPRDIEVVFANDLDLADISKGITFNNEKTIKLDAQLSEVKKGRRKQSAAHKSARSSTVSTYTVFSESDDSQISAIQTPCLTQDSSNQNIS